MTWESMENEIDELRKALRGLVAACSAVDYDASDVAAAVIEARRVLLPWYERPNE